MRKNIGNVALLLGTDLRRVATGVLIFWACAFVLALPFALQLPGATRPVNYEAPPGSLSVEAEEALERHFPGRSGAGAVPVIVMIRSNKGRGKGSKRRSSVRNTAVARFSTEVSHLVNSGRWAKYGLQASGFYLGIPWIGVKAESSYIRELFLGRRSSSTLIFITPSEVTVAVNITQAIVDEFVASLRELCDSRAPPGTQVLLTGALVMASEMHLGDQGLEGSLIRMEAFVVPFGTLIFWTLVSDVRMLLLPPLTLMVTLVVSFALVLPMARVVHVSPDFLPTMVACIVAFSLDYSLLLLMRFSEGRSRGMDPDRRVSVLLLQTGHTILVSGTLVIIAFMGAWLLPVRNLGIGCTVVAIGVAVSMAVHLTLAPALLLLGSPLLSEGPSADDCWGLERFRARIKRRLHGRAWLSLMSVVQRCPAGIVLAITVLCLPLALKVRELRVVSDTYMFLPQDLPSMDAMRLLEQDFAGGFAEPYMLTLRAPPGKLLKPPGYRSFASLHSALVDTKAVKYVISPYMWLNNSITWDNVTLLRRSYNPVYMIVRRYYDNLLKMSTHGNTALALLYTEFLPRGHLATKWVAKVRRILRRWEQKHDGYSVWLAGGACKATDVHNAVLAVMPRYFACIIIAIALVVFVAFRSALLPLRLALALVLSITIAFSISMLIYQTKLLHPLFPSLRNYTGIEGSVVPISIGVAVALGLDYDIFLVSRIVEYRRRGLSDADSITRGVMRTGSTISGAGAIMALAFSGLYTTRKPVLHQYASVLVASVLLDAFLVRTVLVPALMFAAGGWNWWPREMPEPGYTGKGASDCSDSGEEEEEGGGECAAASKPGARALSNGSAAVIGRPVEAEEECRALE